MPPQHDPQQLLHVVRQQQQQQQPWQQQQQQQPWQQQQQQQPWQQQQQQQPWQQRPPQAYACLLRTLDDVAAAGIDASLAEMMTLSEVAVARILSAQLPAGHGIFLGNSMPIRDMDMYGGPRKVDKPLAAANVEATAFGTAVLPLLLPATSLTYLRTAAAAAARPFPEYNKQQQRQHHQLSQQVSSTMTTMTC